ncbi:MAG: hypothetical protein DCF17_21820 [Shackletoniella antarctica]|jgi:uncharacterized protein YjbI with pentapeptide repeats|uniref:Pentapeptide repeat-containing protein n=1 Tax=Shackletoniella antarctica TaxID=268115 RepID=A0A2W4VLT2_9CYAN|nr:MAG: hypothetical protein DCF17_21820 [Shackletoniella antarctica]
MICNQTHHLFRKITTCFLGIFTFLIFSLSVAGNAFANNPEDVNRLVSTNSCYKCDLTNIDLAKRKFEAAYLVESDLSGIVLSEGSLKSADLSRAILRNAQLYKIDLVSSDLTDADLEKANLRNATLSNADFTRANLTGADLRDARFWGFAGTANMTLANLSYADLSGNTLLIDQSFLGANLSHANLSGNVNLQKADLRRTNLEGTNLDNANLAGAKLSNANLKGANLANANLLRVDLTASDLTGANLRGANLKDAILTGTLGLDPYGDYLLTQAEDAVAMGDFHGAINYLDQIPAQTQAYAKAQDKIFEYMTQNS